MAYTINLTDGSIYATIADGTINTNSSMTLVGKNYAGYGEFLDENFIHLLENSACAATGGGTPTAIGAPLVGQLWWDKTNSLMKVYTGTTWKVISASTASSSAPSGPIQGDLWYDSTNAQLKVYTGTAWILVGPASTASQGVSGAIVDTVIDNLTVPHVVIKLYVEDTVVGTVSKDSTFTPQTAISGFATIGPGIQLSTTVGSALFRGTAANAQSLGGFTASDFLSSISNDTTSGTLGILNDAGLTVGADQDARISVDTASSEVTFQNQTQDGNLSFKVNVGGTPTTFLSVVGTSGIATMPGNVTIGNVTVGSGSVGLGNLVNNNANGVGNIGSSTTYFNTVFAKATSAQYADVAERFAADQVLMPGTVVELGGAAEITKAIEELSENVFGVISTQAAYLMNSAAGTDETHPPVAMTGRVPVRVVGPVKKGDRLVSAGAGLARSAKPGEVTAFNVIGRALEDKTSTGEGLVESIVSTK